MVYSGFSYKCPKLRYLNKHFPTTFSDLKLNYGILAKLAVALAQFHFQTGIAVISNQGPKSSVTLLISAILGLILMVSELRVNQLKKMGEGWLGVGGAIKICGYIILWLLQDAMKSFASWPLMKGS